MNEIPYSKELLLMIDDVATKAAEKAAESVAKDMHIKMIKSNQDLERRILNDFETKLHSYFGMTSQEHAVEHDRMRKFYTTYESITSTFIKRIVGAIIVIILGASAGKMIDRNHDTKSHVQQTTKETTK